MNQTKNATRHAEINAVDDVEKIGKIGLIKTSFFFIYKLNIYPTISIYIYIITNILYR